MYAHLHLQNSSFNSIRWNFMKFCIYFVGMLKNNYINYLIEFEFRGMDFKLEVSN